MLILHTSDWHLGHELYGNDRSTEFVAMLHQIRNIVREHKPDALIIAGDIFDTAFPSSSVQTLFSNAIVEIHAASPSTAIIMTSGNHDSASRHEIFRIPWRALNVYALGRLNTDNPDEHIITLPGKGHVIAVPYVNDRMMPDGFYQRLIDQVADDGLPIVMTAHTTVCGANFDGHRLTVENEIDCVGNINARSIDEMGSGFDYLALGHIHKAQFIHGAGHHRARYSGSPLSVSFDEPIEHSVSLVDIAERGATPEVTVIPLKRVRSLVTLPADGSFLPWDEVLAMLADHRPDGEEYIRLNVLIDKPLPENRHQLLREATDNKPCVVCRINAKRSAVSGGTQSTKRTLQEFQQESPLTIAREYAAYIGSPLSDSMLSLLNDVYNQVTANE